MDKLKHLDIIRLIKELDFVESEYNYKSEMIKEMDVESRKVVANILNNSPDLKSIFTKSVDSFENNHNHKITSEHEIKANDDIVVYEEKNSKLKSLYRTIAKTTHPDVSHDESLKEIYLEATKAYEDNNLYPIISICNKLKIPFEINDEEYNSIKNQILALKMRSEFLETTYTWQWYTSSDFEAKNQIVLGFIKSQII